MDETVFFAKTNFRGKERTFGIKTDDRRRHTYVLGKTGVGKSVLLENMILQDIRAGRGLGMIDPHGESADAILKRIPKNRIKDVVYFNPADNEYPVGFNILEVSDPKYKHLVASDLMGVFTKIWANVWSARMEYILNNCVLALLDTPGSTLLGIMRLLVDRDYRQKVISNVQDPVVKSFWINEYERWQDKFRSEAIAPIQNKVGQFLSTSLVRNIIGQSNSTVKIPDIMNEGKILIANVAKGRVGEDNSALLGAMLITKVQLAAMERVRIVEEERRDFYLYVDEFQNFATDSFASILSEARKYRLNLTIGHQYIGQLVTDVSTKVRDAVFGNVGTMIVFRVGAADAEFLENEFVPEFEQQDLVNLPNFNIYLKLMVNGVTSRPFSATTLPPFAIGEGEDNVEEIIKQSRALYSRPRAEVEKAISEWSGIASAGDVKDFGSSSGSSDKKPNATCWSCSKDTYVGFEPDGIRPIYCKDCLKKVQAGEIEPVAPKQRHKEQAKEPRHKEYEIDLSVLGIGGDKSDKSVSKDEPTSRVKAYTEVKTSYVKKYTPRPPVFKREETKKIEPLAPVSLEKALKQEPSSFGGSKRRKKEVDVNELKRAIEESSGD